MPGRVSFRGWAAAVVVALFATVGPAYGDPFKSPTERVGPLSAKRLLKTGPVAPFPRTVAALAMKENDNVDNIFM